MKAELYGGPMDGREVTVTHEHPTEIHILRVRWYPPDAPTHVINAFYERRREPMPWDSAEEPNVFDYIGDQLPPGDNWRPTWHSEE